MSLIPCILLEHTPHTQVAFWLMENGLRVLIAACDTFRSGAVEQLRTHTHHLNALHPAEGGLPSVSLYAKGYDKDAAGVATDAIHYGKREGGGGGRRGEEGGEKEGEGGEREGGRGRQRGGRRRKEGRGSERRREGRRRVEWKTTDGKREGRNGGVREERREGGE